MKKKYSVPRITIEKMTLDQPVALGCTADYDDMVDLIDLGYFGETQSCSFVLEPGGTVGGSSHDTICYHSNVQTAFLS